MPQSEALNIIWFHTLSGKAASAFDIFFVGSSDRVRLKNRYRAAARWQRYPRTESDHIFSIYNSLIYVNGQSESTRVMFSLPHSPAGALDLCRWH
jgi:hypothetical protein